MAVKLICFGFLASPLIVLLVLGEFAGRLLDFLADTFLD